MKFSTSVLGLSLVLPLAASAKKFIKQVKRSQISPSLLRNAPQVTRRRRLDGNNDFEVTADHNVLFNSCINLKYENENVYNDDVAELVQGGDVDSYASFVVFTVCEKDECYYEPDDLVYVVDLATWVENTADHFQQRNEEYCEQCQMYQGYCEIYEQQEGEMQEDGEGGEEGGEEGGDEGAEQEGGGEEGGEGGGEEEGGAEGGEEGGEGDEGDRRRRALRVLEDGNYVDCSMCESLNCFVNNDDANDDGIQEEDVIDFLKNYAECQQIQGNDDDGADERFAKLVCSEDMDGVKIGVFADEDCTLHVKNEYFQNLNQDGDVAELYELHDEVLAQPYNHYIDCEAVPEFDDPYADDEQDADEDGDEDEDEEGDEGGEEEGDEEGDEGDEEGDEGDEDGDRRLDEDNNDDDDDDGINQVCKELLGNSLSLSADDNCGKDNDDEQDEEEENENDNDWFYDYELAENDIEDLQAVCVAINALEYEYYRHGVVPDDDYHFVENKSKSSSRGYFGWFIFFLIVGSAAIAFFVHSNMNKKKKGDKSEPLYDGGAMS